MKPRTRQMLAYQQAHEEALREDIEREAEAARAEAEADPEAAAARHDELLAELQAQQEEGVFEVPEGLDLSDVIKALEETEADLGLERVKPEHRMNRKQRRDAEREIKRVTRRPSGIQRRWEHPILKTRTPWAVLELARRRRKNKAAKAARKVNRGRRRT